jgi:hypothetical protein
MSVVSEMYIYGTFSLVMQGSDEAFLLTTRRPFLQANCCKRAILIWISTLVFGNPMVHSKLLTICIFTYGLPWPPGQKQDESKIKTRQKMATIRQDKDPKQRNTRQDTGQRQHTTQRKTVG